jgi:hypothetical protein
VSPDRHPELKSNPEKRGPVMKTTLLALVILTCTISAVASDCPTATLNNLLGSSCSIGDVQFTFTSYTNSPNQAPPSAVMFTPDRSNPEDPSFTLTGDFAADQSGPSSYGVEFGFDLNFQAEAVGQYLYLTGLAVELGGVNVSPMPNPSGLNEIALSNCVGSCPSWEEAVAYVLNSQNFIEGLEGTASIYPIRFTDASLEGYDDAFNPLGSALTGFGSATASFAVDPRTPEPAAIVLTGTGLLLLAFQLRWQAKTSRVW